METNFVLKLWRATRDQNGQTKISLAGRGYIKETQVNTRNENSANIGPANRSGCGGNSEMKILGALVVAMHTIFGSNFSVHIFRDG